MPWSRQMTSRDGNPVAAGSTSPPATLRCNRACAVNFTRTVLDMNFGFWPGLLVAAPDPPGDGPRSVIAKADADDRTNADTAIDKDTVLLRDLFFIFSSIGSGMHTILLFHGKAAGRTLQAHWERARSAINAGPCI